MTKINWAIGCSGFHYKEWKGIFYPESIPQKEWFKFYAQKFNTLELNVTFYRFPVLKSLETWYNTAPDNFSFAVKVPVSSLIIKNFQIARGLSMIFIH